MDDTKSPNKSDDLGGLETREITIDDLKAMDINILRNGDFSGTFGPFGKPLYKEFLCPLCSRYQAKRSIEITQHLYKELAYFRFECGVSDCGKRGLTYTFVEKHMLRKHGYFKRELVHLLPANKQIESWCEMVLFVQTRLLAAEDREISTELATIDVDTSINSSATVFEKILVEGGESAANLTGASGDENQTIPLASPSTSKGPPFKCSYCDFTSAQRATLPSHEKRHWAFRSVKCGYCDFTGNSLA